MKVDPSKVQDRLMPVVVFGCLLVGYWFELEEWKLHTDGARQQINREWLALDHGGGGWTTNRTRGFIELAKSKPTMIITNTITTSQWIEKMRDNGALTNVINVLVADGTFCQVRGGHKWEPGCGVNGCLVVHYDTMRHCLVCGTTQAQERR